MIIGVSGGDILLGIKLLKDTLQALSRTKGSQKQYVDAVKQLETLEICLKVAQCKLSGLEAEDSRSLVARAITECANCIEDYQRDILSKYEKFFGNETEANARRKFVRELKKIQWLSEKERTETLAKAIASHVQIITLACSIGSLPSTSSVHLSGQIADVPQLVSSERFPEHASALPQSDLQPDLESPITAMDLAWKGKSRGIIAKPQLCSSSGCLGNNAAPTRTSDCNHVEKLSSFYPYQGTANGVDDKFGSAGRPSGATWQFGNANVSRTTIATTQTAISVFSLAASDAMSITSRSTATTASSRNQWVDERGFCHHPGCQKRSFLQRKAFSLYVRLSSPDNMTGQGRAGLADSGRSKAACEHVLLYLENMASADSLSETRRS